MVVLATASSVSVSACYDAITTAATVTGVTAANLICNIAKNTTGPTSLGGFPCQNGIVIVPGTGAVISSSFT